MKKFKVSGNCNACGRCFILTDLLIEKDDGKAEVLSTGYIADDFVKEAQEIIDTCPVNAISIIEVGNVKSIGKIGLKELERLLKDKLKRIEAPKAKLEDVKFSSKDYGFNFPNVRYFSDYKYSSDSQAERAALDEFDRTAYSQYRPMLLKVFVEYKNWKLKPFYTFDTSDDSFYYRKNKEYEEVLKEIGTEARALTEGKLNLPKDFETFEVYLGDKDSFAYQRAVAYLGNFETKSTEAGIMAEFRSSSYSSLDSYKMYIDTDDMETSDGVDWRGNLKYKTKYRYSNVDKAIHNFFNDLKSAMDYADIDEDLAFPVVEEVVGYYKKEIDKTVEQKLKEFSEAISLYE